MTQVQIQLITECRKSGCGYKQIAKLTGLSVNTIKSFCRRNNLMGSDLNHIASPSSESLGSQLEEIIYCEQCGRSIIQLTHRKRKRFCSDSCRSKWWNAHLDQVNRKANYEFECPTCHKTFTAYGNKNRKYCSHTCYIKDRFGGDSDE